MKNLKYIIVYFVVAIVAFDAEAIPFYIKGGCNFGVNYSDSLKSKYVNYERLNIDINTAIGYKLKNNFFYEFEVRYARIKPAIQELVDFEKMDLVDILQRIIGKKTYVSKIENIFEINNVTALINFGYDYIINDKLTAYLSYGVGIGGLFNYQGFRSNTATHYGISMQNEIGLCYTYNKKMSLCIGYNYLKNYWKYDTDKIYDEDGNSVIYHFRDFQLKSHTVFANFKVVL
ncbi:hypothetical protein [Ehrlichia canis]|uniref:Uncharacterized protein n=1 Tax=Ehrlichia canis (strain Jake) TaxID=269484 RepID=A0ACA6AVR2_EHRCJ|nr:hypothetical protein [Ehrlichia canis]AAZ68412.1 hypothetical protein Ecaj_0369 [Ehrlichia canis str. Jake]AUO54831.1 hypothetical protein C1I72_02980 [Ehrlichia canis]UKC53501.1 hypothetical protein s20019040002_000544 [Ehrlichia canis]UKC54440.1 hypothetical protein s20026770001_000546 [Ehrlichia canis]UKC55376.1 hypothetical protein s21009500007_000546 [Ehrlichia canis]